MRPSFAIIIGVLQVALSVAQGADAAAIWSSQIQPLFDVHCVKCHGPIEQKSGLDLDTPEAVLKGGDEGLVIVPGKPLESRLYKNLLADSDPHMPPKKQLTDPQIKSVKDWIAAMAEGPVTESKPSASPRQFDSVPQAIDVLISEGWERRGVQPSSATDDATWCRRVYLDLAGRIPTPAELAKFLGDPEGTRRQTLVDQILGSEDYVVRMRELWDVILMGRTKRDAHEDRRKKNGWWSFLENAFRTNRPWNETVRDVLTARSNSDEAKGASWFLYERRNDHQIIAEAVAPVVYGTKIDCAQCHDHPLAREIKQAHYWGLVAAFNRSKNIEGGSAVSESAIGGFINFTNLKKESQPAVVRLLNGKSVEETRPGPEQKEEDKEDRYIDPKAKDRVPKFSRRAAFADAATLENPLLARAFVNRMWASLIGRGIVHPADEMNARNAPSHPKLLDWLSNDFATHRHDVRRLVRGIVLSRVYGLSSGNATPESFAASLERPLSGEQISRSWRIVSGLPAADDTLRRAVVGAIPDLLPKEYNATFQQAQFLANSSGLGDILKPSSSNTVTRLVALHEVSARVRDAFLTVHSRPPDAEELGQGVNLLRDRPQQPAEGVRDLLWAMMTSAEFLTMP